MIATVPDLLRLIAIPVFAWATWKDIKTRRISDRVWVPLVALGIVLLVWETVQSGGQNFLIRVGISLLFIGPLGYAFYWFGAFGGADAKMMIALSVLLPTFPTYSLGGLDLPIVTTELGVFSLTALTNGVLLAVVIPGWLAVNNLLAGRIEPITMFLSRPVDISSLPNRHGWMSETVDGFKIQALDLDVLRMYCRWRGLSVVALRSAPDIARDPDSIGETNDPTGGRSDIDDDLDWGDASATPDGGEAVAPNDVDDPWGVDRFFEEIDRSTYGVEADQLRDGLELLARTEDDTVWVSPGLPFVVPMFLGLLVAFTYGDLLFALLGWLGLGIV